MKLISLSIFLSALFLSILLSMLYSGNKMLTTVEPLIEASKGLKFEATEAHLWFEEIISGDRVNNITPVWQRLDLADSYAIAMLEGGEIKGYSIIALDTPALREEVQQTHNKLIRFSEVARQRYKLKSESGAGGGRAFDQEFDKVFQHFIENASYVEKVLHNKIQADSDDYRKMGIALLVTAVLLASSIILILFQNQQRNIQQLTRIKASRKLIDESNEKLKTMAYYDPLTNLPNRVLLTKLLNIAIEKAEKNKQWLVLFFIDLDHFKLVNDSFGHQAGDKLLQRVAERLTKLIRAEDRIARVSGDEFALLLAPEDTQQQAFDYATRMVKKIQIALAESYYIEETFIFITSSVGIALYPKDGDSADNLLKNADRSMCDVKQMGKNNYRFFSAELEHSTQRKIQLEGDLSAAIQAGELELYYQPQWNFKTGKLHGLEALVRWNHPENGIVFPDEFICIAENSGLIYQLDMWVFEAACKQMKQWENNGIAPTQLSINMSAVQFLSPHLAENIASLLAQYEIQANKLEIEIIESILMQDSEHTLSALAIIKDLGIRIAVDDFGTGYSSMAYLSKFPIDSLKIDRAFVSEIDESTAAKVIIESIINMAIKLDLSIVAEGIETKEQNQFLATHGCTSAQGFLYNKPMPANEVYMLLQEAVS